ncbi:MAG: TolC family protein [Bacteroidetes bacterium]|nr:MAG: TolC family protein [Bacteroidota bacterium]
MLNSESGSSLAKIGLFLLLCTFLPITLRAQSLEDLLQTAARNNPQLQALEQEYRAELERVPQVGQLPEPEAMAGFFLLPVETRVGAQRLRLGATQMFPWKGTLPAREAVVQAQARAKYEQVAATRLDLFYQVKTAWLKLYELEKSQAIVRRNLEIFQAMERFALSKVESGKGSAADVLRIQIKTQELEQELRLLENAKAKPLAALNEALNRPPETPVTITDSLQLAVIPYDRDTLLGYLSLHHPLVRMLAARQEAAQNSIALNHLEGKPSFGLGLDYILVDKRDNVELPDNGKDILSPRIAVRLPIYRKKYEAKEREEQLKIQALENRKQQVLNQFIAAIQQAWSDRDDAELRLQLYEQQTRATRAALDILETDYSTAGRNFDELLRLQSELVEYDLKSLKAIVKSHLAKATVERLVSF